MARLNQAQLADEAGVAVEFVRRAARAGVLVRAPGGYPRSAIRRVEVADALDRAGVSVERMGAAIRDGELNLDFLDRAFIDPGPRAGKPAAATARAVGGVDRLRRIYEVLGLGPPAANHPPRAREDALIRELAGIWDLSGDPELAIRAARVVGQSADRVANGWVRLYYELIRGLATARGGWTHEVEAIDAALPLRLQQLVGKMLPWVTERHIDRIITDDLLATMEGQLGPFYAIDEGRRGQAVAFVDLTGYGQLAEEEGDEAAARSTSMIELEAAAIASGAGGRLVKVLGDGVLLHFPAVDPAIAAVLALHAELTRLGAGECHAGIDAGRVLERDGDIFGRTVIRASRLADHARSGQILATRAAAEAATDDAARFRRIGPVRIQGIVEPIEVMEVRPTPRQMT